LGFDRHFASVTPSRRAANAALSLIAPANDAAHRSSAVDSGGGLGVPRQGNNSGSDSSRCGECLYSLPFLGNFDYSPRSAIGAAANCHLWILLVNFR